jgi:hypothetical protein
MSNKPTSIIDEQARLAREAEQIHQAVLRRYRAHVSEAVETSDASSLARLDPTIQQRTTQMSEPKNQKTWHELTYAQQAALPERERRRLRAERDKEISRLESVRAAAKSYGDYHAANEQIALLMGSGDGPPSAA